MQSLGDSLALGTRRTRVVLGIVLVLVARALALLALLNWFIRFLIIILML